MIASLRGTLLSGGECPVLEVGGIGFSLQVSARTAQTLPAPGSVLFLFTCMQVKQDAINLFGFREARERDLFTLLQEVNGLGPKVALNLLSAFSAGELMDTIVSGKTEYLVRVPGVGPKLAQRMVLELKDKLAKRVGEVGPTGAFGSVPGEAAAALAALGFTPAEIDPLVGRAREALGDAPTVEDIVSYCLKYLGQRQG